MGALIHTVCAFVLGAEDSVKLFKGLTFMIPFAFTDPQPPVNGIL